MYKPKLKISMQFFADEATDTNTSATDTTQKTEQTSASTGGGDPEVSTQKADESKEQSKLSDEEKTELEEYRKWKESKKTDEEKQKDALSKAEKARLEAESKVSDYEAKFLAVKKGVSADNVDDIIALAKLKVTKDVTMEKAIVAVIEKYPHFATTNSDTTGAGTSNSESATVDENKIRKIMGLPINK